MWISDTAVTAMHPHDPTRQISLICHPQTVTKLAQWGDRWSIGAFWGLVHGDPPRHPDPEAPANASFPVLRKPIAVFQGLKRPLRDQTLDEETYIHVSNPPFTCYYKDHVNFGGVIKQEKPPIESVFTVFASLNRDLVDAALADMSGSAHNINGVILLWEWTDRSPENPSLPFEYGTRYVRELWRP
jgi:hypothetical protein